MENKIKAEEKEREKEKIMETREFFARCKSIHDAVGGRCRLCPLEQWCRDGIFSMSTREMEDLVGGIEKAGHPSHKKDNKTEEEPANKSRRHRDVVFSMNTREMEDLVGGIEKAGCPSRKDDNDAEEKPASKRVKWWNSRGGTQYD